MTYRTETANVSAQFVNQNFIRKIEGGHIKEAQVEGSAFIREKMREQSFAREILTPVLLADDEIDRDENTDQPKKIIEKEPDSVATFVNFQGTGPHTYFHGPRYSVSFGKVESQRFNKSKFELMTYQNDIRKILSDNSVKDMADEEDRKFLDLVQYLIDDTGNTVGDGTFSPSQFALAMQELIGRRRPIGKWLMTKGMFYNALTLDTAEVGDAIASRHYDDGVEEEERLWGIPVVTTIKADLMDSLSGGHNVDFRTRAYLFSPENYLGNFFLLQDATLYIEQKADMINFWSYEAPGIGIGNRESIQALDLSTPAASP